MGYIKGSNRHQLKVACLDDMVDDDSMARIIDAFVDSVDLGALGFTKAVPAQRGRSPYAPACMAKLYLLGYERGVRSSRKLERACHTDLEFMWLIEGLKPDFKTIADFRRDNKDAFRALFEELSSFFTMMGLFGKKVCAIDGTKIKASNSKKAYVTKSKLEKAAAHHEMLGEEYLRLLDRADGTPDVEEALDKAQAHTVAAEEKRAHVQAMEDAQMPSFAMTDPDCAMMASNNGGLELAYNVQASVDAKAHLVAAFSVTSEPTDHGQLSKMATATREAMGQDEILALADKGYCGGKDLALCEKMGLDFIVACQDPPSYAGKDAAFASQHFVYDANSDTYLCPGEHMLSCHSKKTSQNRIYHADKACATCQHKDACVPKGSLRRTIRRRPFSDVLDRARKKYDDGRGLYKLRQEIVEHVFGTVKCAMGCGYLLLRGLKGAECEMALAFSGYNLKRAVRVLGNGMLMEGIAAWARLAACSPQHASKPTCARNGAYIRQMRAVWGFFGGLSTHRPTLASAA
jgi:transposase